MVTLSKPFPITNIRSVRHEDLLNSNEFRLKSLVLTWFTLLKFPSVTHSILVGRCLLQQLESKCRHICCATARPKQRHSPYPGQNTPETNHHGNPQRRFTWNIISYLFKGDLCSKVSPQQGRKVSSWRASPRRKRLLGSSTCQRWMVENGGMLALLGWGEP